MSLSKRQKKAYSLGIILTSFIVLILIHPNTTTWHAYGPIQSGHIDIACTSCHIKSTGTLRQQLQARVQFVLGNRSEDIHIGTHPITNKQCLACHARDDDNHPVYRFNEPRFAKVRTMLQPQKCLSCHLEHTGKRVTQNVNICKNCHEELNIKHDPLLTTHFNLVKQKRWQTCLGCHDFHGNHVMDIPKKINNIISIKSLKNYFADGDSPYPQQKHHQAKKKLNET